MNKVDVAGLKIDAITKEQFLAAALARIKSGQRTSVFTPYSEFLYHSFQAPKLLEVFNSADFSVADGIGIFWAKRYLEIPLTAKSYWGKILQALWQLKYSLAAILFNPGWVKSALPEKIVGADLIWDLAKLAANNNFSIFLLGGFGDTPKIVAEKLSASIVRGRELSKYLKIAGYSNKGPDDLSVIEDVNRANPDLIFVAYGPIKQEKWIYENLPKLNTKLAIGVGGSFDYIAGKKSAPPKFIRYSGLEWLWRLFTQPKRVKRIINATFGLMLFLLRYKIFMSYPYRQNVVSVILNNKNNILVCRRNPNYRDGRKFGLGKNDLVNYWQFPQGGIENNEDVKQTALRECREEVGLTKLLILKVSPTKVSYLYPNEKRPLFGNSSRYKGQHQSIVYLRLEQPQEVTKIDDIEFIDYKWVPLEKLVDEVHEHRKEIAQIVQRDLKKMQEKAII